MRIIGIDVVTGRQVLLGERYMLAPVVGEQLALGQDNTPEEAYPRIDRDRVIERNSVGRSTRLVWEDRSLRTRLCVLWQSMTNEMFEKFDRYGSLSGNDAIEIATNGYSQREFLSEYDGDNSLVEFYLSRATSQAWHELCRGHAK